MTVFNRPFPSVLFLVGTESTFFIEAHTVLWFGFVAKEVLITKSLGYYWTVLAGHQGFPCFPLCLSPPTYIQWVEGWVVVDKGLGGDTAGRAYSNWPRGYPILHDIMLSDKSSRRVLRNGDNQSYSICLSKQQSHLLRLCFPGSVWTSAVAAGK